MTIDMSQFFQVFFDETEELLAEMEKLLLAIDVSAPDEEDLNAIFRAAHSIKGGAGTFGLNDLTDVTHVLESLLDRIRKGEMALTAEHVDAFLVAKDILKMQLDGHRLQTPVDQDAVADVRMMLQSLSQPKMSRRCLRSLVCWVRSPCRRMLKDMRCSHLPRTRGRKTSLPSAPLSSIRMI
jgi:two-component system chemotaxis sensor kinase CheA